ncbi:hypothetical protein GGX14DRAFT_600478 [Mycena pura]|uniref:Uncharacterized protein n=1 Tax=Mycena pura TaxID=153505 RepID=A0AAD6UP88_9AGAR|nr:hypothetical protein GGX14DRAFT_600478 [Mycena pura]
MTAVPRGTQKLRAVRQVRHRDRHRTVLVRCTAKVRLSLVAIMMAAPQNFPRCSGRRRRRDTDHTVGGHRDRAGVRRSAGGAGSGRHRRVGGGAGLGGRRRWWPACGAAGRGRQRQRRWAADGGQRGGQLAMQCCSTGAGSAAAACCNRKLGYSTRLDSAAANHSALERERIPIPQALGPNRDKMCPDLYWAIDHPAVPIPNCRPEYGGFFEWEEKQTIPNFATDEQLAEEGCFHVPWEGGMLPIFARHKGSLNAHDDSSQACEVFPAHLKANLLAAIERAMGPEEHVTLDPPKRNDNGTWSGSIALERGGEGRSKPVKPGTRCYAMANSHETARQTWGPTVNAKVYESFDEYNKMTHDLILAAAEMGKFANEQAPREVYEIMRGHASMLNIPPPPRCS